MTFTATNVDSAVKSAEKGNKMPERPKDYISNEKQELLWAKGFCPELYRGLLVNEEKKVMFSFQYACKKSLEEIEAALNKPSKKFGRWTFYFLEKPSRYVRKKLVEELWR